MVKVDIYRSVLRELEDWDQYLLDESCLPGPRANLELIKAVAEEGTEERFMNYLSLDSAIAPFGSAAEFLPICGVVGLGSLIAQGRVELLELLRSFSSDIRWRIREGVAIALQRIGESNIHVLLNEMAEWSEGSLLEKRSVVAALCEPKLLNHQKHINVVLQVLDKITFNIISEQNRKSNDFKILRKSLGYGWSVVVAADPEDGKKYMEKWLAHDDKDIRWIMKENLRKKRLEKMDLDWTRRWKAELGVN
ncbi:hypothetical protein [Desulfosporosinus meridiei]|uniref:HEAT repeat domain-containing protein n=1 Tax=Desulfosporosinus meridiei (strain ATCC BAA-275 / DSM 13257 / KCTC 12902 / NCIMB 13706 / S10) TaxID=768704 RepID=J7IVJ5_DESMD|nr:hypothetical protein [Desulfosporosinus meridiei]AFQ42736.1 hypothetical protein Desmer_0704 [Desulfosporosinus meridiei DSM 13257]